MSRSKKVARSAFIIVAFTLGSKLLGFLRETLIAHKFGSGMVTDTFFVAMTATTIVTGFISKAITTTFIPVLSEIEAKEGKKGKIDHTNNMLNIIFVFSILVVMVEWMAAPLVIRLLARGFEGEQFDLAVKLTRLGLPMILFGGIIGVFTGFLQSEEKFASAAAIGFPSNMVYIIFLLFLSSKFGIKGLMVAAVLGIASQFLILIPESVSAGYKYKLNFDIKDEYIRKVMFLSVPVLIGVAIDDVNAIVDRTIASSLVTGSISALNYSNRLKSLILGVFISAITTVIFPMLSRESNNDNIPGMKKIMNYGVNLILLITIPSTIGLIVLSTPIVQIAFERGAFGARATLMTSQALIFYSMGLVAMALRLLLTRVYYSLQDTKTPMVNSAVYVSMNIVFNIILVRFMAHSGLALATSIAATISTIFMLYGLKRKIGSLGTKGYIVTFIKSGLASLVMGVAVYFVYNNLAIKLGISTLYNLIALVSAVLVGVIVYLVLCYILKVDEIRDVTDKIRDNI